MALALALHTFKHWLANTFLLAWCDSDPATAATMNGSASGACTDLDHIVARLWLWWQRMQ